MGLPEITLKDNGRIVNRESKNHGYCLSNMLESIPVEL